MNLTDDSQMVTTSNTNANQLRVIGYESFGFIAYAPLTCNINVSLTGQEDRACSGIGWGKFFIPRDIECSFVNEAKNIGNVTLLVMYFWFTMRISSTGTPSKSSLVFPMFMVGNISSARQPYYKKMVGVPPSRHNLIEVDLYRKLDHMKSGRGYIPHIKVFQANWTLGTYVFSPLPDYN